MGKMKWTKTTSKRSLSAKCFYIAVALCLIAVGIAAKSAINGNSPAPAKPDRTQAGLQISPDKQASRPPSASSESPMPDTPKGDDDTTVDSQTDTPAVQDSAEPTAAEPVATFFVMPLAEGEIIKNYSENELLYSETYRDMRLHRGLDIASSSSKSVTSAGDGRVTEIISDPQYGNVVVIDHGNGVVGRYSSIASTAVSPGDIVNSLTVIGEIDTIPCECVEKPHLHLEFLVGEQYVSPLSVLENE